jgi:hypothetical protein
MRAILRRMNPRGRKFIINLETFIKGVFCIFSCSWDIIIQCVRKVAVHLQNVLEMMSTNVYTGLNPFNFILQTLFLQICVRKVAVHLQKVLEMMSTNAYTGLNPFNFVLQTLFCRSAFGKSLCTCKSIGSDVHECLYRPESVLFPQL